MEPIDAPVLFVTSNYRKGRVIESVESAGLRVTENLMEANLALNVEVGRPQNGLRRVRCTLIQQQRPIVVIRGRGDAREGSKPNILDEMSRELAGILGVTAVPEEKSSSE